MISVNRAARRRLAKQGLIAEDIQMIQEKAKNDAINKSVNMYLVLSCMVLRDAFGFGTVRLERFLEGIDILSENLEDDYVAIEGYKFLLEDECNISL